MRMTFFRRFRVLPSIWLNLSRTGASITLGARGLKATIGKRGTTLTAGLPGTGLAFSGTVKRGRHQIKDTGLGERLLIKALRDKGGPRR